jgi:hypothetical protein
MAQNEDKCPACGAPGVGGRAGCQALFDQIGYQVATNLKIAAIHDLAFDTYCMQHVETYCVSAKSYAAHLTRLCCGIEYHGDRAVYAAIPRWLNGKVELEKPPILSTRGAMTIVDLMANADVDEQIKRINAWANVVWNAYRSQHEIARDWIKLALARKSR